MKRVRYPAEFKSEAVKQVADRGHGVVEVPALKLQVQHLLCGESAACPRPTTT
jgi:transposase-like protein